MKTKLSIIAALLSASNFTFADEIELTIKNNGTITYGEASCSENCTVNTTDANVLLEPSSESEDRFNNWSGQMRDYGKGASFVKTAKRISNPGGGAKTLQVLDINNDGQPDLFGISLFSGGVTQSVNLGNGEFETENVITNLVYPAALDSIDWNNDGYEDLLVSDYATSTIKVYLNDGNGKLAHFEDIKIPGVKTYSFSAFKSKSSEHPQLVISSFSADTSGNLFRLVESITNGKTAIYTREDGQFQELKILSDRAGITLDTYLDDEEKLNIVSADIASKEVVTYSESNNFAMKVVDTSNAPYGAGFADLDKDGLQDIVTAHYGPFSLRVIFAEDKNEYSAVQEIAVGRDGLTAVAIADFDADGLNDVATGEFNNNKFEYYPMNSYKGCGFNKGSSAKVTANFAESSSTTPSPTSPTPETSTSDSGGSFPVWLSFLAGLLFIRRFK